MIECLDGRVRSSWDGCTVWVYSLDGSTVGRFSKRFGLDVHTTVWEQLAGAAECLHCTHAPAGRADWDTFRLLMAKHYQVDVPEQLVRFALPT